MHEFKDLSGNIIRFTYEDVINAFNTDIEELICIGKINGTAQGTDYNYVYQNKVYGPKALMRCIAYNTNQRIENLSSNKSLRGLFDKLGFERQGACVTNKGNENFQKEIKKYIKKYSLFKQSSDYSEQYKYDYAQKYKYIFDDMSDFADKIRNIEIHNFAPFFIARCSGLKHLINYHLEDLQRALTILLSDGDLKNRILEFKKILNEQLKLDQKWRNNERLVNVQVASYFLFTNDYEKNLLFTEMRPYNNFAKLFDLKELSKNKFNSEEDRYIAWQNYCSTELLPIMNEVLNKKHTLLDAQDFIRFVGKNNEDFDEGYDEDYSEDDNMTKQPLNQILYGPPGTGKTYNTVVEAIKILKEDLYKKYEAEKISYEDLKTEFNELRKQGRIEFVTFHQSYSYEEFVEGIKPDIDSESWNDPVDKLTYKGTNGIFKSFTNKALFERLDIKIGQQDAILDFKNLKNLFIEKYSIGSTFKTGTKNAEFRIDKYTKNSARITPINGKYTYSITFKYLEEAYNKKMKTQSEIATIKGVASGLSCYYHAIYENLLKIKNSNANKNTKSSIKEISDEDKLQLVKDYFEDKIKLNKNPQNEPSYVLIIDEINRGNISKIFGELITLIEEDKRENLSVKLPYSQEEFTVPNNLYIIGTMNTSDRSIASIDIALRRRFKFVEMMPEIDLVADFKCNFQECFKTLNERISILLDRDHQIGHSYFIKEKHKDLGTEELKEIWFDSIIPLLNEYFYGDWDKLQAILGEAKADESSFIKKQTINKTTFAKEIDICETESFDFNLKCDFNSAMKNAFGDNFTIGETNAQ